MKDFKQFLNEFKVKSKKIWRVFEGDISLIYKELTEIPEEYIYDEVTGGFNIGRNAITSLKGSPEIVHGDFFCSRNKLTSLDYCPKEVYGNFHCTNNKVNFTEEQVRSVCNVKGKVYV